MPWTVKFLVTYLCETIGVLPALDLAILQWILQAAVGFHQIICTSNTDILYYKSPITGHQQPFMDLEGVLEICIVAGNSMNEIVSFYKRFNQANDFSRN